ncbi:MAG: RagB/SusD family nutrient uptake outer membrane protein [Rikenellaceae bacterium]
MQNRGDAPWIDKRYAEVLLCRAEAAYELAQLGDSAGSVADAVAAIDDIRQRAGCTTFYDASTLTRDVIRDEFFRELAFENKGYWNLVRWRTYHLKHSAAVRYHAALPVYAGTIDKWFYIVKYSELGKTFTFNASNYYLVLPDNQISANPNIVQNPN